MKILLLEDDNEQAEAIRRTLEVIEGSQVIGAGSVAEFERMLPELIASPPQLVVLDVRVRLSKPTSGVFYEALSPESDKAGLECLRMLRENARTCVPTVVYSSVWSPAAGEVLPSGVWFLEKEKTHENLMLKIRSIFPDLRTRSRSWWRRGLDAVTSIRVLWFSIDFRKLRK
jgi:CheY-like chemotaxis protein